MIITAACFILAVCAAHSAVLDPALYLVPSPPLVPAADSIAPGEMWGRTLEERIARDVHEEMKSEATTQKPAAVESRMFWPRFRSSEPVLDVHIPLTFTLSGSYGKASLPTVVDNTYSAPSVSPGLRIGNSGVASSYGGYGRSALAGSSYGSYGVRVFGGDNVAAWSGWGNGKWGHYGKG